MENGTSYRAVAIIEGERFPLGTPYPTKLRALAAARKLAADPEAVRRGFRYDIVAQECRHPFVVVRGDRVCPDCGNAAGPPYG